MSGPAAGATSERSERRGRIDP